jgi:hypothetical protein
VTNLTPVRVSIGGATGWGIVDTGNPVVELDPETFPSVSSSESTIPLLKVGSFSVDKVLAIGSADGLASPDPDFPLSANIGCGALCGHVAAFNYRDVIFSLGTQAPPPPSALLAASSLDFTLKGGKATPFASRIVVTASIEGTTHTLLLDTGATLVTLRQSVFQSIASDGRKTLMEGTAETTEGTSTTTVTRVRSIAVGGASVSSVVIAESADADTIFDNISEDVGETIDGSLGGTFTNQFYITIDYPKGEVTFVPYANHDFVLDLGENIGFELAPGASSGSYVVGAVTSGSDASKKGVSVGDVVVEIDGQNLASLTPAEAVVLCYGTVGATKEVAFGAAASLADQTVALAVDEFLPLP